MSGAAIFLFQHLSYLRGLVWHKLLVLEEGRRLGLPYGQLLRHDLSKFRPDEWIPSLRFAHGPHPLSPSERAASERALELHRRRNRHHPEYWLRLCGSQTEALAIPDRYRREMLADWLAVGRVKGDGARLWYQRRRDECTFHPETRAWIEAQLGLESDPAE